MLAESRLNSGNAKLAACRTCHLHNKQQKGGPWTGGRHGGRERRQFSINTQQHKICRTSCTLHQRERCW